MGSIPWFQGAPDAYARAARAQRQVGALSSLAGIGGRLLAGRTRVARGEQDEEAAIAGLQARLGEQQDRATAQSMSPQEQMTGAAASSASAGPSTIREEPLGSEGSGAPGAPAPPQPVAPNPVPRTGESTQQPPDDTWRLGRDSWSDLDVPGTVAGAAGKVGGFLGQLAAGANLIVDPGREARRLQIARLTGRVQRRGDDVRTANALRLLVARSKDPGALLGKAAPSLGVGPGDVQLSSPLEKQSLDSFIIAQHPNDPQGAIDAIVAAHRGMKGAGPGGPMHKNVWDVMMDDTPEGERARQRYRDTVRRSDPFADILNPSGSGTGKPTPNPPPADDGGMGLPSDIGSGLEAEGAPSSSQQRRPRVTAPIKSGRFTLTR